MLPPPAPVATVVADYGGVPEHYAARITEVERRAREMVCGPVSTVA